MRLPPSASSIPGAGLALAAAALALLVQGALPSEAHAYEDQVTVGVEAGYGVVLANDALPAHGFDLGVVVDIGVGDAWSIRPRLAYVLHPARTTNLHIGIAGVEVVYLLDILEIVPFFGLGVDGIATIRDGAFGADIGLHAVLGIDWLPNRDWAFGIAVRPYVLPFSLAANGIDPVYLSVTVRASLVFDR